MTPFAFVCLAARLARREMRGGLRGFGVFLACLFLGVFAISAVGSFSAAARRGLHEDARSLLGGDLEIRLTHRPISPQQVTFVEQRGRISTVVEMRAMARSADDSRRALVELKAVDGAYPLYGALGLAPDLPVAEALAERQGTYGALVEAVLLQRLGLAVGDRLRLGDASYQIRAVLTLEPDRAVRPFTLGPRLLVSSESLSATALLTPGSLVAYSHRVRLQDALVAETGVQTFIDELDERFPQAGWRLRGYGQAAPRVSYFLDRLATNLTLVGLCALLVGGLGVAGAVRGYLDGKTLHIAAMKCVGAPGALLFTAYLLQVLVLGTFGSGIGLLAGASVPYLADRLLAGVLPIPLRPGLFPEPLVVAGAFGLLIALAFSLRALGTARLVPPSVLFRGDGGMSRSGPGPWVNLAVFAAAGLLAVLAVASSGDRRLALWFTLGAGLCFLLFRLLAAAVVVAARRAPRPTAPSLRLAIANLHRPGSRAVGAIFSLGLGLTALVAVALVEANLSARIGETIPAEAPSFFFIDIQPRQTEDFDRTVLEVPGVTRLERVPTLRGRITAIAETPVAQAAIGPEVAWAVRGDRFFTFSATPPANGDISAGSWWPADYAGPPLISLTADLAEGFGVSLDDTLTVNVLGQEITARIANLRTVDWSTLELNFAVVFTPGVLESAPQTHIATVYALPDREEQVFAAVTGRFPNVSAIRIKEVLHNVTRTLERIGGAFRGMATVVLLTGFLVLAGAISADQHRRIYDAVIFKVCGATRRDILAAFGAEFLLLGLAAGSISALAGSAAAFGIVEGLMDAEFTFRPAAVFSTILIGLALTLLLGLAGTARALTRKPVPYLRSE